ncbi:ComEC/Rec2 family competence protein [Salinispirillum marinum]|uniref:ComEC/Rec2 family competence protein n=2 Tax=Saccharospirillaceae TaxID=255527 RepID=A0ABV8BHG5_9GAMM
MRKEFAASLTDTPVDKSALFLLVLSSFLAGSVLVILHPFWAAMAGLLGLILCARWQPLAAGLFCLGFIVGYGYVAGSVYETQASRLANPVTLTQQEVSIERCWRSTWGHRCLFRTTTGEGWYLTGSGDVIPQSGHAVVIHVELQPWASANNPGSSPFGLWLMRQGVVAQGRYELQATRPSPWFIRQIQRSREYVLNVAMEPHYEGVYRALVLGDRVNLSEDWKGRVERTQTQHLLALSGLHVGTVAVAAGLIFAMLWGGLSTIRHGVSFGIRQDWYWLGAVLAVGTLWTLALSSVSLERALFMLLLPCFAWFLRLRWGLPHGLLLIGAMMMAADPLLVLDLGAWFSWLATLWLILLAPSLRGLPWWSALILVQIALSCLLIPVYALWELPVFWGSIPLNLLLIPWVTFVVLPSALLTALHLPGALWVFEHSVDLWYWLLGAFDLGFVSFLVLSPGQALAGIGLIGIGLMLRLPWRFWCLGAAVLGGLHFLSVRPNPLASGELDLAVLDVGNALSVVLDTAEGRVLFDLGYGSPTQVSLSSAPLRWHWRYPQRDWEAVVISHQDNDHAGGLASAAFALQPKQVFLGEWVRIPDQWPRPVFCDAGMSFELGDISFRFLRPYAGFRPAQHNDASCVLEIRSQYGAIMLMGDASKRVEYGILQQVDTYSVAPVDVLLSGHHGSSTSTSGDWLRHLSPQWVVHSAARYNRFDFPRQDVQDRVTEHGALNICTCADGTVTFHFRKEGIAYERYGHRLLPWIRI